MGFVVWHLLCRGVTWLRRAEELEQHGRIFIGAFLWVQYKSYIILHEFCGWYRADIKNQYQIDTALVFNLIFLQNLYYWLWCCFRTNLALFIHIDRHCKVRCLLYCLVSSPTLLKENLSACRTLVSTRRATTRCRPLKGSRFLSSLLVTSTSFWKRWDFSLFFLRSDPRKNSWLKLDLWEKCMLPGASLLISFFLLFRNSLLNKIKCLSFGPGLFHCSSRCGGESSAPMTQC